MGPDRRPSAARWSLGPSWRDSVAEEARTRSVASLPFDRFACVGMPSVTDSYQEGHTPKGMLIDGWL